MDRRKFITTAAACLALLPAMDVMAQDNPLIGQLNAYLSSLTTAQARFSQENADGTVINGSFFLKKPGQMRFEYDSPSDSLVIASGRTIAIFDAKSNAGPQRYPQNRTPLSLLSMAEIDVTNSIFVRRIEARNGRSFITLFDPEKPDNGTMVMIFDNAPMALREWIVVDRSGLETRVYLEELQTGMELENRLFNIGFNQLQFARENDNN